MPSSTLIMSHVPAFRVFNLHRILLRLPEARCISVRQKGTKCEQYELMSTVLTLPWCILSGEEAEMSRPWVEARREVSTRERPGLMVRTLCCPQSHRHCSYPDNGHYLHLLRLPDTLTPLTNFCFPFAREGEVWRVVNWSSHIWTLFRVHRQDTHKKIRTWKST